MAGIPLHRKTAPRQVIPAPFSDRPPAVSHCQELLQGCTHRNFSRRGCTLIITHLTSVHRRNDNRVFLKEYRSLAEAGFMVNLVVADGLGDDNGRCQDSGRRVKEGDAVQANDLGCLACFSKSSCNESRSFHTPRSGTDCRAASQKARKSYLRYARTPLKRQIEGMDTTVRHPAARVFKLLEDFAEKLFCDFRREIL